MSWIQPMLAKEKSKDIYFQVKNLQFSEIVFVIHLFGETFLPIVSCFFCSEIFLSMKTQKNTKWPISCMLYHKQMFIHSFLALLKIIKGVKFVPTSLNVDQTFILMMIFLSVVFSFIKHIEFN